MEVALHTVLKEGHERDYDLVHREIPEAVASKLRAAGVRDWRIWRDGRHVFHLVDVEDYEGMRTALRDDPDNRAWQAKVGPFFDEPDSYVGGDSGLAQLWTLHHQLADAHPPPDLSESHDPRASWDSDKSEGVGAGAGEQIRGVD